MSPTLSQHKATISTLPMALNHTSEQNPDSLAFAFLDGQANVVSQLTYAEIERAARARASLLAGSGLSGKNAIMIFPSGLEFVTALAGCWYAKVVGAPLKVPAGERGMQNLRRVCHDAQTTTVISTRRIREELCARFAGTPEIAGLRWIETDTVTGAESLSWEPQDIDPDGLALLQYTSGSAGNPKAVMISHRNLASQAAELGSLWPCGQEAVLVSWLPASRDMGLMFGSVLPLWSGRPSYLIAPEVFIRHPDSWLTAISRFRGTHTAAPNFAYELCVRQVSDDVRRLLDLSSLRVAVNGGEPVRRSTLERFSARFSECGLSPTALCPAFWLAENTLKVSGSHPGELAKAQWLSGVALRANHVEVHAERSHATVPVVSCGKPDPGSMVRIIEPVTRLPCPAGEVGEIWISGPSVGQGYWRREAETRETFRARVACDTSVHRYLRTGDLGFLRDGELYIAGRLKDLLIIDGSNHHPGDIEYTVELSLSQARYCRAAAFAVDGDDGEQLVLVVEIDDQTLRKADRDRLRHLVTDAVSAEHQLTVTDLVLVRPGTLPMTTSSKIRQATRAAYLAGEFAVADNQGRSFPHAKLPETIAEALPRAHTLTPREQAVFWLLGLGYDNRSIARELTISERTVKRHVTIILTKLKLTSRLQAGIAALVISLATPLLSGTGGGDSVSRRWLG